MYVVSHYHTDKYKLTKKSISPEDMSSISEIFMVSNDNGLTPAEKQRYGQLLAYTRYSDGWMMTNWLKRQGIVKPVQRIKNITTESVRNDINYWLKENSKTFTVLTNLKPNKKTPRYNSPYWDLYSHYWQV